MTTILFAIGAYAAIVVGLVTLLHVAVTRWPARDARPEDWDDWEGGRW